QLVRRTRPRLLQLAHALLDAEEVLHVMPELVRDHIRLREVSWRTEASRKLVEEAEVEVDPFVNGAIEGAALRRGLATPRVHRIAEDRELRVAVLLPID